ncbi:MAG: hypothetical protein Q8T08_25790, partial [Ignavibacteria bacterium]|nr:hypothetical protein [Ignavibacteria bacterium]
MKTIQSIIIILMIAFAFGCDKTNDNPEPVANSMGDLVIDKSFNWSASLTGTLTVTFENPLNVSTEREYLQIITGEGKVLETKEVMNNMATFSLNLPQDNIYYVYFPLTQDKLQITTSGNMTMLLGPEVEYIYPNFKSTNVVSCTSCGTPIINAGGELPYIASGYSIRNQVDVPGWKTTASDGKIEIWVSGFQG